MQQIIHRVGIVFFFSALAVASIEKLAEMTVEGNHKKQRIRFLAWKAFAVLSLMALVLVTLRWCGQL